MSYRLLIKIAALASTCWMSVSTAMAENRLALVIGNSNYNTVSALPNPANDAKAMTKFLTSAGFQVLQSPNLTQADMRKTISNFASMVAEKGRDTVALVFYAGHGLQVDGENYLVPVDANIQREADVPLQSMRLADVMNALAGVPSKARIVILDACRNNPFSEINKTSGRGLAIVDAPSGSLVSYSTAPGTEASDGDGYNSPFTTALLKVGPEPGLPIEQALKRIRLAVNDATSRQQTPWESSSLTTEFSFFPNSSSRPSATNALQPAAAHAETRSVESWQKELKGRSPRDAYDVVIREDKVEAYQAYLALYPSQSLAPSVRTLVDRRLYMVAWYEAVTINTVVSYQNFLASYPGSDLAGTANRLIERARTRSFASAANALASAGTCPCSLPNNSTPRIRRTDVSPSNGTNGSGGPSGGGNGSGGSRGPVGPGGSSGPVGPGGGTVAVYDPPTQVIDPVVIPPVGVVTPPTVYIPPPRGGHGRPNTDNGGKYPPSGGDKPGRTTGGDKPGKYPPSRGDKPSRYPTGGDKITRGHDKPSTNKFDRFRNRGSSIASRSLDKPKFDKPMRGSNNLATRGAGLNRGAMTNRGGGGGMMNRGGMINRGGGMMMNRGGGMMMGRGMGMGMGMGRGMGMGMGGLRMGGMGFGRRF